MITRKVKWGKIGVNRSNSFKEEPLILIQTQTDKRFEDACDICCQNRVVLITEQAKNLIESIKNNIEKFR